MKKVLVTGGAGFIGSHIVEELLARNMVVAILDDFSTGKIENLPVDSANVEIITGSINDPAKVSASVRDCDAVIHLAAVASVQASIDMLLATHEVNLTGTLILLEEAKKNCVKHFVFASSAAVYGDTSGRAVSEHDALSPISPYAIDKLSSEYYLNFFGRTYGIPCTAFRFFNVYGPRQNPESQYSGVISKFVANVLCGNAVKVFGNGEQTRDFVFVRDVSKILADTLWNPSMYGKTFNLGSGISTSLNELITGIAATTGADVKAEYLPPKPGDIRHSLANISLLSSELVNPPTPTLLVDGLMQTVCGLTHPISKGN